MHDSADAAGGADDAMVGKLVFDSAVTIASLAERLLIEQWCESQ